MILNLKVVGVGAFVPPQIHSTVMTGNSCVEVADFHSACDPYLHGERECACVPAFAVKFKALGYQLKHTSLGNNKKRK